MLILITPSAEALEIVKEYRESELLFKHFNDGRLSGAVNTRLNVYMPHGPENREFEILIITRNNKYILFTASLGINDTALANLIDGAISILKGE